MADLFAHIKMQECCVKELGKIDKKKKEVKGSGLYGMQLEKELGEKPIPEARKALRSTVGASAVGGENAELGEKKRELCVKLARKHGEKHQGKGEKKVAEFWGELAEALGGGELGAVEEDKKETKTKPKGGTSGMDVKKAVDHLNANAQSKSTGWCSKYVKNAIHAGGVPLIGTDYAKNLGPNLEAAGFVTAATQADAGSYVPEAGDVVVFDAVSGHPNGHAAMYNGEQWVSDFKQPTIFANQGDYKDGAFTVYRP